MIDTRALPAGTVLNLQNVEFAVIIGNDVVVRGGEGANILFAGAGNQNIVLGADDDELYGGDGDDIVGSLGGDDKLHGDAGNDILVGGVGNDALYGGDGDDILQGGSSDAGIWKVFRDAEGRTWLDFNASMSDLAGVSAVREISGFQYDLASVPLADGRAAFLHTDMAKAETIALLYQAVLGRLPDNSELNYWAAQDLDVSNMAQLAYDAYRGETTRGTVETQVRQMIEQVWGSADDSTVQAGVDYIAGGGSWSDGFLWLAQHENSKTKLVGADGLLPLMQALELGESGWSGDAGDNLLSGGAGKDLLIGGQGNNLLDGGEGLDMIRLVGSLSDYRVGLLEKQAGTVDLVIRNVHSGAEQIIRDIELAQIGGVAYEARSEVPELRLGGEFQALADFVQVVGTQELLAMGAPVSWL